MLYTMCCMAGILIASHTGTDRPISTSEIVVQDYPCQLWDGVPDSSRFACILMKDVRRDTSALSGRAQNQEKTILREDGSANTDAKPEPVFDTEVKETAGRILFRLLAPYPLPWLVGHEAVAKMLRRLFHPVLSNVESMTHPEIK